MFSSLFFRFLFISTVGAVAFLGGVTITHASDTTPPVIANIRPYPATSTAAIIWTTDEAASSRVFYGLTSSYGSSTALLDTSPRMFFHTVLLTGLAPCTTYHYQVFSDDADGNAATSTNATFQTFGCTLPAGASYYDWTSQADSESRFWFDVASSLDGERLVGAPGSVNYLSLSTDGGDSWNDITGAGLGLYITTAMSGTGQYILTGSVGGNVRTSSDYGVTWQDRTSVGTGTWYGSAVSTDGRYMVITDVTGYVYVSNDYGVTWTQQTGLGSGSWSAVSASEDFSTLAIANLFGRITLSNDYGVTWRQASGVPTTSWSSVAVSASGDFIAASAVNSSIWTSYNGGSSWTEQQGSGSRDWSDLIIVKISDTSRVIAVNRSGYLHISDDAGVSWTIDTGLGGGSWLAVAASQDGRKVAVASPAIPMYTGFDDDTDNPTISSIAFSPTTTSTLVTWTTNERTSSQVRYGLTSSYGSSTVVMNTSTRVLQHSVTVPNLVACTTYHIALVSEDAYGNTTQTSDRTVTTDGCPAAQSGSGSSGGRRSTTNTSVSASVTLPDSIKTLLTANRDLFIRAQSLGIALPPFITAFLADTSTNLGIPQRDLSVGSTGSDVLWLQQYLIAQKLGPAATALQQNGATSYFGLLTQAALREWQLARGIVPASGYFGALSRAALSSSF